MHKINICFLSSKNWGRYMALTPKLNLWKSSTPWLRMRWRWWTKKYQPSQHELVDEYELRILMTQELLTTVLWQTELDSDISEASCGVLVTETTYIWYHKIAGILHLNIFVSLTAGEASKQSLIIQIVSNWCLQTSDHQVHRPLLITNWLSPAELKHYWLV